MTEELPRRRDEHESVPQPGPWWVELYPSTQVSRTAITNLYARTSQSRSRVELRSFTEQLNGFALGLAQREWGKALLTPDGIRCMTEDKKGDRGGADDLAGWARVLDIYGRFADPLARYVAGYYPRLHALRPRGFSASTMDALKDLARCNAPTALRTGMLNGFDGLTTPIFETESHTQAVIAAIAAGTAPDGDFHERYAKLAYANELRDYATKLADKPGTVLNREKDLTETKVLAMAGIIAEYAAELRAKCADDLPSLEASAAAADELLVRVDEEIANSAREIIAMESAALSQRAAAGPSLEFKKIRSQYFAEARDSTRDELINLTSRGHLKTGRDALSMFLGRVNKAVERNKGKLAGTDSLDAGHVEPTTTGMQPQPEVPSMSTLLGRLADALAEFRDEIPAGFGDQRAGEDTAEFAITLHLLDHGIAEAKEVRAYCGQEWSRYESSAIGGSSKALADNVINTMQWVAIRSGLKR